MRIAIATSSLPPSAGIGGVVDELAKCFSKSGNQVLVFNNSENPVQPESYPYRVENVIVPADLENEFLVICELYNRLLDFNPDVVLINDSIYFSSLLPALPTEWIRLSVIHGNFMTWISRLFAPTHIIKTIISAGIYNYQYLDRIIVLNESMKKYLDRKHNLPQEQVKVIYNGFDPKYFPHNSIRNFGQDEDVIIMFGGGTNSYKGYRVFFRSLKLLYKMKPGKWRVIWAGGPPKPPKWLSANKKLAQVIDWRGRLNREDMIKSLEKSHILVMPSYSEGAPMLLSEGLALGVIPIVSDCPSSMREQIKQAQVGEIVKTGNSVSLANAISKTIDRKDEFPEMSKKVIDYFNDHLAITKIGDQFMELMSKRRTGFEPQLSDFPPKGIKPYHRRNYKHSKWDLRELYCRFKRINGILPHSLKKYILNNQVVD